MGFQGNWFCGPQCAQTALEGVFRRVLWTSGQKRRKPHRVSLGLLLVSRGIISNDQLQQALCLQREKGHGKLGYWLRETGAVDEKQLAKALSIQWSCPVFPLEGHHHYLHCARLLPFALLESERVLPVHYNPTTRQLYLAIADHVDHTLLYAIEQMLGCRTIPCVAAESGILNRIEQVRHEVGPAETLFDSVREPREMARTALNYAETLGASELLVVPAGAYVWVKFRIAPATRDLLFQVAGPSKLHSRY